MGHAVKNTAPYFTFISFSWVSPGGPHATIVGYGNRFFVSSPTGLVIYGPDQESQPIEKQSPNLCSKKKYPAKDFIMNKGPINFFLFFFFFTTMAYRPKMANIFSVKTNQASLTNKRANHLRGNNF